MITYVGSFAVYQGIDLLFESIPLTVKKDPRARFVIIGGSEKEIAERSETMSGARCVRSCLFSGESFAGSIAALFSCFRYFVVIQNRRPQHTFEVVGLSESGSGDRGHRP